ncbi:hypothetical protein MANES_17G088150v8 [Manihot esculenta]|uniref:Uncharacterized protein n=1 Tax=Manihot esculenta TaxID=3983 RepID=A0ACB7G3K5_MANES|nr:hypothetical protein MANES_17G088150v8 [Manihot esculenta]
MVTTDHYAHRRVQTPTTTILTTQVSLLERLLLLSLPSLLLPCSPCSHYLSYHYSHRQEKPEFDLQQVRVQYMGIPASNLNSLDPTIGTTTMTTGATTASLSLTIHMLFTAVNPNKVGIKYSESKFTVMYHGIPLGKASVPGFYQEAHSERQVEATISVDRYSLIQANAVDLIRDASLI